MSVALVIQHTKRKRLNLLQSMIFLAAQYFSILSHEWQDFVRKFVEYKMWGLIFNTVFVQKVCDSKNNSAKFYHNCTNTVRQVQYRNGGKDLMNGNSIEKFSKNSQI